MIEDNSKVEFDDLEKACIENEDSSEKRQQMREKILQAKLKRASKIAEQLSKE